MLKHITIGLFGAVLLVSSCKKEEEQVCPELVESYSSLMSSGDTAIGLRARVLYLSSVNNDGCEGYFLDIYSGDPDILDSNSVFYYRVINDLPEYVINYPDLQNAEWLVDVEYLGIGIECTVAYLVDPAPGTELQPSPVELVEVNSIQLIP